MNEFSLFVKRYKLGIIIIAVILVVAIVISLYINYLNSTFSIKIIFPGDKINSVKVIKVSEIGESVNELVALDNIISNKKYRLPNTILDYSSGDDRFYYKISYNGQGDYDSGYEIITDTERSMEINLNPEYNKEKKQQIIKDNMPKFKELLYNKYPKSAEYLFENGEIFENGKWYFTKLTHTGEPSQNSDNLRIIFARNEDNQWYLATDPSIILLQKNNQNIPLKVLLAANQYEPSQNN